MKFSKSQGRNSLREHQEIRYVFGYLHLQLQQTQTFHKKQGRSLWLYWSMIQNS